ncbi:MAG: DUF3179 domain-containing protein [Gemmatimonadota bacterium]
MHKPLRTLGASALTAVLAVSACSQDTNGGLGPDNQTALDGLSCSIPESEIFVGAFRDGIPALTNPEMDLPGFPTTSTWQDGDRVVGMMLGDQPIAVPLNIFWWHEIVNLDIDGHSVAITHCPLTGSSLAFDRAPHGGVEFGVSGLLFRNNMVLYDRVGEGESLWPQMSLGARCGPQDGTGLQMLPVVEMTYGGWRRVHPNTLVVTTNTGWDREYESPVGYPYGNYDDPSNAQLLFPISEPLDRRYPPKERALGVPSGTGGTVFPYSELSRLGPLAVVPIESDDPYVVFWTGVREGAMAYRPFADGQALTFRVEADRIVDDQTGSIWNMSGIATGGPLSGTRLEGVSEAFVAFWFSWPLFFSDIEPWSAS